MCDQNGPRPRLIIGAARRVFPDGLNVSQILRKTALFEEQGPDPKASRRGMKKGPKRPPFKRKRTRLKQSDPCISL